jgi:outer membrane immunogenic protein
MLRLSVSVSALALLAGVAAAADLPPPPTMAPVPMMSPVPIAYNWSGFYLGAHGGWGFGSGGFSDGFVVGGQVGVNAQWDSFVLGVEGDGSYVDWGKTNAVGTVRLRGGFAFDRFLAYGTGGAAFGDDIGWVAGGGGEYAITDNFSVGVEYLHYDFGSDTSDVVRGRVNYKFSGGLFGG